MNDLCPTPSKLPSRQCGLARAQMAMMGTRSFYTPPTLDSVLCMENPVPLKHQLHEGVHPCCLGQCFVTPWTVACQAPLSVGFPRQEYWSALPFPSPMDITEQESNLHLLNCRQILYHCATWEALHEGRGNYLFCSLLS